MAAPPASPKQVHIEALQSAIPRRLVEPGRSRRISAISSPLASEALQSRLRIVFYYHKAAEEESAWTLGAWMKESIGVALADMPELAGRLRRDGKGDGHDWEVKFNDAGVRLVQAKAEATMSEFLESKDREAMEAALAYWVDVDAEDPDFSALFYVQVTQFEGDGYSIGISCSLLLADPLLLGRFLQHWVRTHAQMLAEGQLSKTPFFHLGYFQRQGNPKHLKSIPINSTATAAATISMHFNAEGPRSLYPALASACIEKLGGRAGRGFALLANDDSGNLRVEFCQGPEAPPPCEGELGAAQWDELGVEELAPTEGNKPVHVSYRVILGDEHQGLVVVMQRTSREIKGASELVISATVPEVVANSN